MGWLSKENTLLGSGVSNVRGLLLWVCVVCASCGQISVLHACFVCVGCCFWVCFENFIVDASIFVDYFVILTSY